MDNSQLSWCLGRKLYTSKQRRTVPDRFEGIIIGIQEIPEWEIQLLTLEQTIKKLKVSWCNQGAALISFKQDSMIYIVF
jgi:hypothetical protein